MVDVSTTSASTIPPRPSRRPRSRHSCRASWGRRLAEAGAVGTILRLERFQPPRHRALDARVLARRRADRAWSALRLLDPDALHGRRLVASTAPTLGHVVPVSARCSATSSPSLHRCPARWPCSSAGRPGAERLRRCEAPGACTPARDRARLALQGVQVGWDGWGSHRLSRLAVPLRCGPVAPSRQGVAWAALPHLHGDCAPLRLPHCPARGTALVARAPLPCLRLCVRGLPGGRVGGSTLPGHAQAVVPRSPMPGL